MLVISVIIPLLLLGLLSYWIASSLTEEKAKQSGMNTLRQISANLEFIVQDVESMSLFLIGNESVQSYLDPDLNDPERNVTDYYKMMGFLTNLAFPKKYISDITIQPLRQDIPALSTFFMRNIIRSGAPEIPQDYFKQNAKLWTSLYENEMQTGKSRTISLVRPIRDTFVFKTNGMMNISLNEEVISQYLRASGLTSNGYVLLLDKDNKIISGEKTAWLTRPLEDIFPGIQPPDSQTTFADLQYGKKDALQTILYYKVPDVGWTLMGVIPNNEYRAQNKFVLTLTAISVTVSVLLVIFFILYFVQRVTRPLVTLARIMKKANPDTEMQAFNVSTSDEVGELARSYNKFSNRISDLTEQVKRNEARKKEADMQALQAQINPHFLYNTLSSVHWMALMNKDNQIAEMVGALSDFLRFSLNRGEEFCPIHQEIAHAKHYMQIQQIRYPDQFEVAFIIDPELHDQLMLKLLLQPLIENALIHGIMKKREPGSVHVYAHLADNRIAFAVEDTGIGMDEQTLSELRKRLDTAIEQDEADEHPVTGSYGLRNVHRRLVLHYGYDAKLFIESEAGRGTKVTFTIPARMLPM